MRADRLKAINERLTEAWGALTGAASIADNNGDPELANAITKVAGETDRLSQSVFLSRNIAKLAEDLGVRDE